MTKQTQVPQPNSPSHQGTSGGSKIGSLLKTTREQQGKSIEQIARVTKINVDYIRHIENGETEMLPANIFLKGYVLSIAKMLGLEKGEVIKHWDLETADTPLISKRTKGMDSEILLPSIGKSNRKTIIPTLLSAACVFAALCFVSVYFFDTSNTDSASIGSSVGSVGTVASQEQPKPPVVREYNVDTIVKPSPNSSSDAAAASAAQAPKPAAVAAEKPKPRTANIPAGTGVLEIHLKDDSPVEIAYRKDLEGSFVTKLLIDQETSFEFKKIFEVYCTDYKNLRWVQNGSEVSDLTRGSDKQFTFKTTRSESRQ